MSDQVSAKVIAHSKAKQTGKEVITFELEFPRIVLAEFNTHNALSKNSSSSRAIPVMAILEQVRKSPAMPVRFGAANKGMQDAGEHNDLVIVSNELAALWGGMYPDDAWYYAANQAADLAQGFHEAGYAKQICNRLIEPFQRMKVVMTATELANFLWLRDHPAADPTIEALAKGIKKAYVNSVAVELNVGDWHTPYYGDGRWLDSGYMNGNMEALYNKRDPSSTLKNALDISASCCAQVSYRKLDDSAEKASAVVGRLNLGVDITEPMHVSPTEHQCTPIAKTKERVVHEYPDQFVVVQSDLNSPFVPSSWQEGVTHVKKNGTLCSGNLEGWVQYRKLIKGNCYGEE